MGGAVLGRVEAWDPKGAPLQLFINPQEYEQLFSVNEVRPSLGPPLA